jgi:predicted AAA+ superfamily ATPase
VADQLAPFLKGLLEAVASAPRAVCVLTLAEASDAFGRETEEIGQALTALLGELRSISARVERTLSPTAGEDEIGRILVHRLFERVDQKAGREAATSYRQYFERLRAQGADLPATATQGEYANLIEQSYPFHPELLITLNRKTSTIANFQRTRGALRLLARAIRRVWQTRPADATLFHLHHLDLGDGGIADELTGRLDRPRYKQVIEADIASGVPEAPAHAEEIDTEWRNAGRPAVAVKAATTVFLHSLTQQAAAGARTEEVNLAVLSPGDEPALLDQALKELERRCWHVEYEGERWRFQPEP